MLATGGSVLLSDPTEAVLRTMRDVQTTEDAKEFILEHWDRLALCDELKRVGFTVVKCAELPKHLKVSIEFPDFGVFLEREHVMAEIRDRAGRHSYLIHSWQWKPIRQVCTLNLFCLDVILRIVDGSPNGGPGLRHRAGVVTHGRLI